MLCGPHERAEPRNTAITFGYWNDLSNIYITLAEVYGYDDAHIIVLCSDGLDPTPDQSNGQNSDPDLDGDGDDDIEYACTLATVNLVFGDLANLLTPEDQLFVFTTDHGGMTSGSATHLNLWSNQKLEDHELAALVDALPPCDMIFTMEPCHSGRVRV